MKFPFLFLLLLPIPALATPAQVVIIRHGEKPSKGNALDQQGCERAYLLPGFFDSNADVNHFGKPVATFGQQPDAKDGSIRPVETIAPTAEHYGYKVDDSYERKQYQKIVRDIFTDSKFNGKTVLIAWEHDAIPDLAKEFGVDLDKADSNWKNSVFDEAWLLRFPASSYDDNSDKKSLAPTLEIVPEKVLPGDSTQGQADWDQKPDPGDEKGGKIPQAIADECVSGSSLESLADSLAEPPLPN